MANADYTETQDKQDFGAPYKYVNVMIYDDGSEFQLAPLLTRKDAVLTGREAFEADERIVGWAVKMLSLTSNATEVNHA